MSLLHRNALTVKAKAKARTSQGQGQDYQGQGRHFQTLRPGQGQGLTSLQKLLHLSLQKLGLLLLNGGGRQI